MYDQIDYETEAAIQEIRAEGDRKKAAALIALLPARLQALSTDPKYLVVKAAWDEAWLARDAHEAQFRKHVDATRQAKVALDSAERELFDRLQEKVDG